MLSTIGRGRSGPAGGFVLLGAALLLIGCAPTGVGTTSGYANFTAAEMRLVDADAMRHLQFFTSSTLRLTTGEQALEDSISTDAGRLMKIQTRHQRSIEIPARTPGVLVELGNDWLDLDVGDGVVLRFRETGEEGLYQCMAFNGQPIAIDAPGATSEIEYQGERYQVDTLRPVFLQFYVRHVVNVDRANQTIGGKRIDETERKGAY